MAFLERPPHLWVGVLPMGCITAAAFLLPRCFRIHGLAMATLLPLPVCSGVSIPRFLLMEPSLVCVQFKAKPCGCALRSLDLATACG